MLDLVLMKALLLFSKTKMALCHWRVCNAYLAAAAPIKKKKMVMMMLTILTTLLLACVLLLLWAPSCLDDAFVVAVSTAMKRRALEARPDHDDALCFL